MRDYFFKLILLGGVAAALIYFAESFKTSQEFDSESLVDAIVDSGNGFVTSETITALQAERKIVVTASVNANFSKELICNLLLIDSSDPGKPIDLYLRTEGGWEADAFAVVDTIRSIKSPVNIHALGEVHSAGLMVFAAATGSRTVYPNTILGFHTLDTDEDAIYKSRYLDFWRKITKLPEEWLNRRDDEMIYFSTADALKYKIADKLAN